MKYGLSLMDFIQYDYELTWEYWIAIMEFKSKFNTAYYIMFISTMN